jgi:hypothetical protein
MRSFYSLAMAAAIIGAAAASPNIINAPDSAFPALQPVRRTSRGKGQNNRRGKGFQDRPKRRPNMLRVSKRIRRKHRRAK